MMNKHIKGMIYIVLMVISYPAAALTACNFVVPESRYFKFKETGQCWYHIDEHKDFANENILSFNGVEGIDSILLDKNRFYEIDGQHYFSYEDVDEPSFTIRTINLEPAKPVSVNGFRGYTEEWDGFMQKLAHYKKKDGYSLNVRCVSIALGNAKQALTTKFCAPHTTRGDMLIERYKNLILRVRAIE